MPVTLVLAAPACGESLDPTKQPRLADFRVFAVPFGGVVVRNRPLVRAPVAQLYDQFGEPLPRAGVIVHAFYVSYGLTATISGDVAVTDSLGRATFDALTVFADANGRFALRFETEGASPAVTDTLRLVPDGTLAWTISGTLFLRDIDGLTVDTFLPRPETGNLYGAFPHWSLADSTVVTSVIIDGSHVRVFDPRTGVSRRITGEPDTAIEENPRVSPDGQWVYYMYAASGSGERALRRSTLDGTITDTLGPVGQYYPSPSPDGRLVYNTLDGSATDTVIGRILDLGTREVTDLRTFMVVPRWSPRGDLIAYLRGYELYVMRPDGSEARNVAPGQQYAQLSVDWSPDGSSLIALNSGTLVEIIDVASGMRVRLPWSESIAVGAAWGPRLPRP